MTNTYALIDSTGLVVNVIVYDGHTPYTPPDGLSLVPSDGTAEIGGSWDGTHFHPPGA